MQVFGPKVATAQHLDSLSRTLCPELEHFVAFSSVVSGRGNSGQCNYAAANSGISSLLLTPPLILYIERYLTFSILYVTLLGHPQLYAHYLPLQLLKGSVMRVRVPATLA